MSGIDSDVYFEELLQKAWDLPGGFFQHLQAKTARHSPRHPAIGWQWMFVFVLFDVQHCHTFFRLMMGIRSVQLVPQHEWSFILTISIMVLHSWSLAWIFRSLYLMCTHLQFIFPGFPTLYTSYILHHVCYTLHHFAIIFANKWTLRWLFSSTL